MNGDDFIKSLRLRLGSRTAADLPSADIIREVEFIRKTVLEKAPFKPWFLQNEDTSISTVALQEYVDLPAGFLGFDPDDEWSDVSYKDTSITSPDQWVPLTIDDFNTIKAYYKDAVTGKPEKGGLVGTRLYMRPIPDAIYQLRFRFYKSDTALDESATENLWLKHGTDWLMGEVGVLYASQIIQNQELVPTFDEMRKTGRQRVYFSTVARSEEGKARAQGDE